MESATKQRFIDYLERHLCDPSNGAHRFVKAGPRSFFFRDDIDTIFVKVADRNLVIVTDGEDVVDHIEMLYLPFNGHDENDDDNVFNLYLQDILSKF